MPTTVEVHRGSVGVIYFFIPILYLWYNLNRFLFPFFRPIHWFVYKHLCGIGLNGYRNSSQSINQNTMWFAPFYFILIYFELQAVRFLAPFARRRCFRSRIGGDTFIIRIAKGLFFFSFFSFCYISQWMNHQLAWSSVGRAPAIRLKHQTFRDGRWMGVLVLWRLP